MSKKNKINIVSSDGGCCGCMFWIIIIFFGWLFWPEILPFLTAVFWFGMTCFIWTLSVITVIGLISWWVYLDWFKNKKRR